MGGGRGGEGGGPWLLRSAEKDLASSGLQVAAAHGSGGGKVCLRPVRAPVIRAPGPPVLCGSAVRSPARRAAGRTPRSTPCTRTAQSVAWAAVARRCATRCPQRCVRAARGGAGPGGRGWMGRQHACMMRQCCSDSRARAYAAGGGRSSAHRHACQPAHSAPSLSPNPPAAPTCTAGVRLSAAHVCVSRVYCLIAIQTPRLVRQAKLPRPDHFCAQGAISLTAPPGAFSDRIRLEFWLYMGTAQQAPKGTVVVIGGDSVGTAACLSRRWSAHGCTRSWLLQHVAQHHHVLDCRQ